MLAPRVARPLIPITLAALACGMFLMCGCAVGRNPLTGGIVFGADLGRLAENTNQVVAQAVDQFLPGLGTLASIAVPSLAGVGTLAVGWARSHAQARAVAADKAGEDRGWALAHGTAPDPGSTASTAPVAAPDPGPVPSATPPAVTT